MARLSDEQKAAKYEQRAPGVEIPMEQKAERFDRYRIKDEMRGQPRRRRLHQSIVKFSGDSPYSKNAWCDCGKFKHEGNC